ncbi:hypothetical protein J3R83DRAFT_2766 [Lanmaoa asiatica]|nr:hypothetical protein J3R83DRAFT_2766 [Lanmaoa asiatica]
MDSSAIADTSESSGVADHVLSRLPSAVAALSNLISPVNSKCTSSKHGPVTTLVARTTVNPKSSSIGPGALPTEILMLIFQFAFEACVDWHKTDIFYTKHTTVWLEDDPLSPSLFPYSLASVCVRWLHILSSIPVYWTRQVITVDFPRDITDRHPDSPAMGETDRDEHARVRVVLDLLRIHIHHTWSLTFNVRYSSSLPALWREQGNAQYLSVLTLMSSSSDTGSKAGLPRLPQPYPARNSNGQNTLLKAHFLEEVTLGGHFLNDALMFGEQRNHWFCNITFLTIRGNATSDGSGISLYRFITTIQTCGLLKRLTVEDIAFINDVHPSYRFRLEAPVVCLRRITDGGAFGSLMSQSLGTRLKDVVIIADCPFDGFGEHNIFRTRVSSINLILEGMSTSASAIEALICFWNGENLSLINCPAVSGSFLRRIPTDETPPDLRRLRLVDCENVSAGALMALVRSREIQSEIDALFPGDPDDESCAALVALDVHGWGPPIDTEQALWFAEHVETFSWNTITKDGLQYSWNTSARELMVLRTNH